MLLALLGSACSDSQDSSRSDATSQARQSQDDPSTAPDASAQPRQGRQKRKVIHTGNGGKIILPAPPTVTETVPGPGCVKRGSSPAPPRPGLQASATASEVVVDFDFGSEAADCRPALLFVTMATADGTATTSVRQQVGKLEGTLSVEVPKHFPGRPEVVRVSGATSAGRLSSSASVLVR